MNERKRREFGRLAAAIEVELKRMNVWRDQPLPPELYNFRVAFGGDTMAFENWIQFILLPRLNDIAAGTGAPPPHSSLSVYATREFDGREEETWQLWKLLHEVDELIGGVRVTQRARKSGLILLAGAWAVAVLLFASSRYFAQIWPWRVETLSRTLAVDAPPSNAWRELWITSDVTTRGGVLQEHALLVTVQKVDPPTPTSIPRAVPFKPPVVTRLPLTLKIERGQIVSASAGDPRASPAYGPDSLRTYLVSSGVNVSAAAESDFDALRQLLEQIATKRSLADIRAAFAPGATQPLVLREWKEKHRVSSGLSVPATAALALPIILLVVVPVCLRLRTRNQTGVY